MTSLQVILSGENTAEDVSTSKIADSTEGFSGSDLRQLCTAAAMCGIRELMKATSKASSDKAAAKKARQAAKQAVTAAASTAPSQKGLADASCSSPGQSTGEDAGSSSQTGGPNAAASGPVQPTAEYAGSRQENADTAASTQQVDTSTGSQQKATDAGDVHQYSTATQETADGVLSSLAGDTSAHVTSGEGPKQLGKSSKSNKRDIEQDNSSSSSNTKRLKASSNSPVSGHTTAQISAEAAAMEGRDTLQAEAAGSSHQNTLSTQDVSQNSTDSADSTATRQQLVQHQQPALPSSPERSQTVDWLLNKFSDVASAADKQVCNMLNIQACKPISSVSPSALPGSLCCEKNALLFVIPVLPVALSQDCQFSASHVVRHAQVNAG